MFTQKYNIYMVIRPCKYYIYKIRIQNKNRVRVRTRPLNTNRNNNKRKTLVQKSGKLSLKLKTDVMFTTTTITRPITKIGYAIYGTKSQKNLFPHFVRITSATRDGTLMHKMCINKKH